MIAKNTIKFTVPGTPTGKGRPKFFRRGNHVGTYTPKITVSYENLVRMSFAGAYQGPIAEGPVSVQIRFYFPIPKSWSKKLLAEQAECPIPVIKKPDIDNLIKSILDGLGGHAFKNDSQVFEIICTKRYSVEPRSEVSIFW